MKYIIALLAVAFASLSFAGDMKGDSMMKKEEKPMMEKKMDKPMMEKKMDKPMMKKEMKKM